MVASPGKPVLLPAREYLAVGLCWFVVRSGPMSRVLLGLALPQHHPQGTLCPPWQCPEPLSSPCRTL